MEKQGLKSEFHIDSAGTASYHVGDRPDDRTLQVLKENGVESPHRARQLSKKDFVDFDYILVMDEVSLLE